MRRLPTLVVVAALALLGAACGDSSEPSGGDAGSTQIDGAARSDGSRVDTAASDTRAGDGAANIDGSAGADGSTTGSDSSSSADGASSDAASADASSSGPCPILTYVCATGCCPSGSEVVSDTRAQYPQIIVSGGDIYATYAIPDSGVWRTGVAIYSKATATWKRQKFSTGYPHPQLRLASSGRLHHHYGRSSGAIVYQYSDDKGATWKQLGAISGKLMIGGACALDVDSKDRPHMLCGFEEPYGYRGVPRYIRHDGSKWLSTRENFQGSMGWQITMHIGFADRPHLVHTYGPTSADLHYTFYNGSQWVTEAVPYGSNLQAHPDRTPGFALGAKTTVHIAFIAYDKTAKSYAAYYARRTLPNTWLVEQAIPASKLGAKTYDNATIALDKNGEPVIFTATGAGARRLGPKSWKTFQSGKPVNALAVEGNYAYVTYGVDGASYGMQRLHLTLVDIR